MTVDVGMKNLAVILFEHPETVSCFNDIRVVSGGVHDISASSVQHRIQLLVAVLDKYLASCVSLQPVIYVE